MSNKRPAPDSSAEQKPSLFNFGQPPQKKQKITVPENLEYGKNVTTNLITRVQRHRGAGGVFSAPMPFTQNDLDNIILGLEDLKDNFNLLEERTSSATKATEMLIHAQVATEVDVAVKCIKELQPSRDCSMALSQMAGSYVPYQALPLKAQILAEVKEKMKGSVVNDPVAEIKDQVHIALTGYMRKRFEEDMRSMNVLLQKAQDGRK